MSNWIYAYNNIGGGDQTTIRRIQFEDCKNTFMQCQEIFNNLSTTDTGLQHIGMIQLHEHLEGLKKYLTMIYNSQINSIRDQNTFYSERM